MVGARTAVAIRFLAVIKDYLPLHQTSITGSSMKQPAIQFYTSDWLSDSGVRSVSLAARGLWIDMLCYMSENEPRGYLKINGRAVTNEQLARMVGCDTSVVSDLLKDLRDARVFSVTRHGIIYCRRMVADEKKRNKCREYGKLGGNPALTHALTQPLTPPITGGVDMLANPNPTPSSSSSSSITKEEHTPNYTTPGYVFTTPKGQALRETALKVLHDLNSVTGKKYQDTYPGIRHIIDRLNEGANPDDMKAVIRKKAKDKYFIAHPNLLCPETLFEKDKYAKYLIEKEPEMSKEEYDRQLKAHNQKVAKLESYQDGLRKKNKAMNDRFREKVVMPLKDELLPNSWDSFINQLVVQKHEGKSLTLYHPEAAWVTEHYMAQISELLPGIDITITSEMAS